MGDVAVDPAVLAAADPDLVRAGQSDPKPDPKSEPKHPKQAPDPEADIPKDSEGRPSPPARCRRSHPIASPAPRSPEREPAPPPWRRSLPAAPGLTSLCASWSSISGTLTS